VSWADTYREAIAELVERRRNDKRFLRKLDENVARHTELLRALRDG